MSAKFSITAISLIFLAACASEQKATITPPVVSTPQATQPAADQNVEKKGSSTPSRTVDSPVGTRTTGWCTPEALVKTPDPKKPGRFFLSCKN